MQPSSWEDLQFDREALARVKEQAARAVWLTQSEHRRGAAVDFDRTGLGN
ncbi:hypothetical protein [Paraburkholderia sp. GAS334]